MPHFTPCHGNWWLHFYYKLSFTVPASPLFVTAENGYSGLTDGNHRVKNFSAIWSDARYLCDRCARCRPSSEHEMRRAGRRDEERSRADGEPAAGNHGSLPANAICYIIAIQSRQAEQSSLLMQAALRRLAAERRRQRHAIQYCKLGARVMNECHVDTIWHRISQQEASWDTPLRARLGLGLRPSILMSTSAAE